MIGIAVVDLAKCWTLTVVTEEYLSVDRALHQQGVTFLWGEHASHLRETDSNKLGENWKLSFPMGQSSLCWDQHDN